MRTIKKSEKGNMDRRLRVYMPSKDYQGHKLDNEKMSKEVYRLFLNLFNGCTTYKAKGLWRNGNGRIVKEDIEIVEAYTSGKLFKRSLKEIKALAEHLKNNYRQEAIAIFFDDKMHLF